MIGYTLGQKIMELNSKDKSQLVEDFQQNSTLSTQDEASKLWSQYQKTRYKKKIGSYILFSFVLVIIVILVIIGIYIVLSSSDPFHSL